MLCNTCICKTSVSTALEIYVAKQWHTWKIEIFLYQLSKFKHLSQAHTSNELYIYNWLFATWRHAYEWLEDYQIDR